MGLQLGAEVDAKALAVLERLEAGLQVAVVILKGSDLVLMLCGVEVTQGGVGLAVQTLAREAALLDIVADVAALAEEDTRDAGESFQRRYDARG